MLADQEKCELVPFAMETYGAWGPDAVFFLRVISDSYSDDPDISRSFYLRAIAACTFAAQRGNAAVSAVGLSLTNQARAARAHAVRVAPLPARAPPPDDSAAASSAADESGADVEHE